MPSWCYIIRREAPRCSFYSDGHMPEPQEAGRVTDTDSHALFLFMLDCESSNALKSQSTQMKKLLLLFVLVLSVAASSVAQNANRSGVFVEAGTGILVGTPPISDFKYDNNKLSFKTPKSPDINFSIGYRRAFSNAFAWEIKVEPSFAPNYTKTTFVIALIPGFRYTTKEIFGNSSLYFGINVGFAMGTRQDYYSYSNEEFNDLCYSCGAKFSICGGFNITSAFYAGAYCNYSILPKQISKISDFTTDEFGIFSYGKINLWGSVGIRLGYRF